MINKQTLVVKSRTGVLTDVFLCLNHVLIFELIR